MAIFRHIFSPLLRANERLLSFTNRHEKGVVAIVVITPFLGFIATCYTFWHRFIGWNEVIFIILSWMLGCLGVTIGFHRYLTHGGFEAKGVLGTLVMRIWVIIGSMAAEGPPITWVGVHRRHHAVSDKPEDPHSPINGFWHAHTLWLFRISYRNYLKHATDLVRNQAIKFISEMYFFWLFARFLIGYCIFGWNGILWTLVAIFLTHHSTWSVNSICHMWGYRPFKTDDDSRNNWFVGLLSMGEGFHNAHHAHPKSAKHGMKWWEIDISWYIICLMYWAGLITKPIVPTIENLQKKSSAS